MPLYVYPEVDIASINVGTPSVKIGPVPDNKTLQDFPYIRLKLKEIYLTYSDWINAKSSYKFYIDKNTEKENLREQWKQMLGADIFFLYFKGHEIKNKVEKQVSVRIFKLKGKLELKKDQARFIFSVKF